MLAPFERALAEIHSDGLKAHKFLWMWRVRNSRNSLVKAYQQLTVADRKPIDYSSPAVQAAYLYAYAMPRAYFTSEMLRRHRIAMGKPLFAAGEIEVVSFGGGPASELVGLIDYLDDPANGESVTAISYRVFDKDGEWSIPAEKVVSAIASSIPVHTIYEQVDFADQARCTAVDLSNADLVIFSYLMSELCALANRDQIAENFRHPVKDEERCRDAVHRQPAPDFYSVFLGVPTLFRTTEK